MSCLAEGVKVIGKMVALRDDGTPVPIVWLAWPEEDEDAASPYEVLPGGRLVPCDLGTTKLSEWRKVITALVAEGGG